jgi:hypothetical protein
MARCDMRMLRHGTTWSKKDLVAGHASVLMKHACTWKYKPVPSNAAIPSNLCVLSCRSAYEHPRFYCIELEEHHQVEGPELSKASTLFAKGDCSCCNY